VFLQKSSEKSFFGQKSADFGFRTAGELRSGERQQPVPGMGAAPLFDPFFQKK